MSTGILIILISGASSLIEKLTQTISTDRRKKYLKRITVWGYVNILLFVGGVVLSIYDNERVQLENEKLADLNRFLSLAQLHAPPFMSVKFNFKGDIPFDLVRGIEEREAIIQRFRIRRLRQSMENHLVRFDSLEKFGSEGDSVFDAQMSKLRKYYIDTAYLANICDGCLQAAASERFEFVVYAGRIFGFYIPFSKHLSIPAVVSDTLRSMRSIERIFGAGKGIEADRVVYNKNGIRIDFTLDQPINIGTLYQSAVDDLGKSSSAFLIHFKGKPDEDLVNRINSSLNSIDSIEIIIPLDELGVRIFRIRLILSDWYAVVPDEGSHESQHYLVRTFEYEGKPEITDR